MSSRRKSRPVRRLDARCVAADETDEGSGNVAESVSRDVPDSPLRLLGNEARESNSEDEAAVFSVLPNGDSAMRPDKPPEGVYVLEPQAVSDDEGSVAMTTKADKFNQNESLERKRLRDIIEESLENSEGYHGNVTRDGLDLSVKRRKTDDDLNDRSRVTMTSLHADDVSSELVNEELSSKYEKLVQLLTQQHPLVESMQEVGLTRHDLASLQRIRSQLGFQTDVINEDKEHEASSSWNAATSNDHNWQNEDQLTDYEKLQDICGPHTPAFPATTFSAPAFQPAVAAAVMASLVASTSGQQQEFLHNKLKQSPGPIAQVSSSSFASSSGQYQASADSMDTITAGTVSSGVGSIKKGTLDPTSFDEDVFDKYITKYTAKNSCMQPQCPHINRDHYHCTDSDCNFQRFTNKSDVIRHYNMHKKRDNSLAHGFMRFAPNDNCTPQFGLCHFKGKSTHYHCLHTNCCKVYTSTSDVMTHENFHKKNQQFVTNGFQRYRATELCGADHCPFSSQRTTHFHCTRRDCNFTFKNKCDIEKHKAYHTRDDAYTRQGFKKFYKNEPCNFPSCAWNRTANHFHCLRKNCDFSFTSTSQMVSHKRKHDRQDLMGVDTNRTLVTTSASILPRPVVAMPTVARLPHQLTPAFVRPPIAPYLGCQGQPLSTFSFLSPFVTANLINRPVPPTLFESRGNQPKYDPAFYQETARKVLAKIPSSVAAALPKKLSDFASKPESSSLQAALLPVSTSSTASPSEDGSFQLQQERPPPPYMEVPDNSTLRQSPDYEENDGYHGDDQDNWTKTTTSQRMKGEFKSRSTGNNEESEALNLSSKGTVQSDEVKSEADADEEPTQAVLKYFRGLASGECALPACVFASRHHFHCIVQDCCALFVDKQLVLSHTLFHERLERSGITQVTCTDLPFLCTSTSRAESSRDPDSPPPGYIALSMTNRTRIVPKPIDAELQEVPTEGKTPETVSRLPRISSENLTPVDASRSAMLSYLRMIQEKSLLASGEAGKSPYMTMQIPAQQSLKIHGDSSRLNDGYLHVRPGMACTRQDCKYLMQNHWHCTLNRCRYVCKSLGKAQTHREAHDSLEAYAKAAKECFKSYTVKKNCPNPNCEFRLRGHYHCLKPGCQFVTIGTSKLPWHMKKHEKIAKREASGFKYFTKKEQCGKCECKYNGLFSHYHCIRAGCAFAFQYKHQMSTHVRKHLRRMLGRSYTGTNLSDEADVDHTNVDSGDDSLPLIVDEADEIEQRPGVAGDSFSYQARPSNPTNELNQLQLAVLEQLSRGSKSSFPPTNEGFDMMNMDTSGMNTSSLNGDDMSTDDEVLDLRAGNAQDVDSNSLASGSNGYCNEQQVLPEADKYNEDDGHTMAKESLLASFSSKQNDELGQGSFFNKFKLNNDVMEGFKRFESSENCGDPECVYTCKVSHYHCLREDCNYRFTGRTHMFKHHQHHERVAGLVRDDFKRFKPSQSCEMDGCQYDGTSTHFHCLRCDFKCADTAKVGTHRRLHVKNDTLEQWGFERLRGKDDCRRENCKYRERNTSHFHCLQPGCSYTVVGLSSIEQHYKKHKMMTQTSPQVNFNILAKHFINQSADSSFNSSNYADSPVNAHNVSCSFPFSASSSTPSMGERNSTRSSPGREDRAVASPTFNTSVLTSQLNPGMLQAGAEVTSVDFSKTLNLSLGDRSGAIAGVSL
ncbi:zinc finger protein castor homolog 1-like isoform X2 [Clavelina lepadiformis]|uniref:zinc finger protein castor homolog 1-like isoform X2 n=1 Tax=Clavelina lepadiformis TaxID=159417 RepID=UPI0040420569